MKKSYEADGLTQYPVGRHLAALQGPYNRFNVIDESCAAPKDGYGNAESSRFDLARDGAFQGLQISVLDLFLGAGVFSCPKDALTEKGFVVHRWEEDSPPSAGKLAAVLESSCQLWIISGSCAKLGEDHLKVIRAFFDSGRGVYIWGDNDPFFADANLVADNLFGGCLSGNVPGDQVVEARAGDRKIGFEPNHLINRGLKLLYEGVTVSTVRENALLDPVVYGSGGNLVVATYDRDGKRAILDGGFTRLYHKWDSAGTSRYVRNAAAWLVNYERFGSSMLSRKSK